MKLGTSLDCRDGAHLGCQACDCRCHQSLFPDLPAPEPTEPLSPDQRRTQQQTTNITSGVHPLTRGQPIRLHPQATRNPDDRVTGPRCGECAHLTRVGKWLKCDIHTTRSAATDARLWWPACEMWDPS